MKKIYILTGMLLFATAIGFAQGGNGKSPFTPKKGKLAYTPIEQVQSAYFPKGLNVIKPF